MDDLVPDSLSIEDIYPDTSVQAQKERWKALQDRFTDAFGMKAFFVARSPGRVNLIGEHIDYSLYEVLPMAVATDVLVAVADYDRSHMCTDDIELLMFNTNPKKYEYCYCEVSPTGKFDIDAQKHDWSNYFKAGYNGAVALLRKEHPHLSPRSMKVMVDGNVPAGGGLSSSAAFVCASALAVLRANGRTKVKKRELAELAIASERAVGVNSGGMDQSASVLAVKGDALSVSFWSELRSKNVPFPEINPPITFMIAQSFVTSDKQVTAPQCYNLRVVECTLAAVMMAKSKDVKLPQDSSPLEYSLRGLHHVFFNGQYSSEETSIPRFDPRTPYKNQIQKMLGMVSELLPKDEGYTREDIATTLGYSVHGLEDKYMRLPVKADRFMLAQRARHVFSEALRVIAFKELLQSNPRHVLPRLGNLMNETQDSCRDVYECSCAEIDQLCSIAQEAGAYGSRLTGAGWGGCTVHLVPRHKVAAVREAWNEGYYRVREPGISHDRLEEAVVISEPGQGAVVVELQGPSDSERGRHVERPAYHSLFED